MRLRLCDARRHPVEQRSQRRSRGPVPRHPTTATARRRNRRPAPRYRRAASRRSRADRQPRKRAPSCTTRSARRHRPAPASAVRQSARHGRNAAVSIGANAVRSACFGTSCRNAPSFMRTSSPNSAPAVVPRNAGGTGRPAGEPGRPDGRARPSRRPRGSRPQAERGVERERRPVDERRIVGIGIAVRDRCDGIGRVHADSIGAVRCRMFRVDVKCRGAGIGRGGIATTADRQAADR